MESTLEGRHAIYQAAWYLVNSLLIVAAVLAIYSGAWEYSTRRYLRGFSDAIIPATAPPEEKIEVILNWIAQGPTRQSASPNTVASNRDPTDTLNFEALLRVCGTATNAFINLASQGGLPTRRLLLLNSDQMTKHVVAEVFVDGRWIVVDPAFRVILRGAGGQPLTREELLNPQVLAEATKNIDNYDRNYTFEQTAHVRIARLRFAGPAVRKVLDRIVPGWQDWPATSLVVERESLAAAIAALTLVLFLCVLRVLVRSYGEYRLHVRPVRVREQLLRAMRVFFDVPS